MKKVILGIALLSQFAYGTEGVPRFVELAKKENQSLVPLSFFQASESRFKEKLEESVQNINNGSDLGKEVVALGDFCHGEFEYARKEANGIFSKWVEEQLADQEEKMRETIASKDKEIRNLQARLDPLLNESPNISEGIRILDEQRREAEENVRKIHNKAIERNISDDVFTSGQENLVNSVSANVFEELNARKEEIQQRSNGVVGKVDDILGKTRYMYGINAKSLVQNLELQHRMKLSYIASQYNEKRERMEEAYEQQKSLMQKMIDEAAALNLKLKKEKELHERISRVFIANSIKAEKITIGSGEINRITDIFEKRATVRTEYSKFELFSDLLRRKDLGINAKQRDLAKVSEYLNSTKISQKPAEPTLIRDAFWQRPSGFHRSLLQYPDGRFIWNKYGMVPSNITLPRRIEVGTREYQMVLDWYNRCKNIENAERRNAHNNAMSAWNAEVAKAASVPFPSEEFDRLVEQFNVFVSKL